MKEEIYWCDKCKKKVNVKKDEELFSVIMRWKKYPGNFINTDYSGARNQESHYCKKCFEKLREFISGQRVYIRTRKLND
jgi:protein-arginine kinase activator protein McsA